MAFIKEVDRPKFTDLKRSLSQSKVPDNALYQTIQTLLEWLDRLEIDRGETIQNINNSFGNITQVINYLMNNTATYLTTGVETSPLPNSVQLLAGTNITFTDSPNKRVISASGSGGGGGGMNLDYLGNYAPGPVYNDGDIVVGDDGIAYMCVVDGTTTPPEPWPGVGIGVNVALDATYWTVTPHSGLINERAMNGLGTGYVRSTVGEPSVVPTIPLTDTTGILPDNRLTSNVALKNIDNHFVAQTLASYTSITGPTSLLTFNDTAGPGNGKIWRFLNYNNGNLYVESLNDAQTVVQSQFYFRSDGYMLALGFAGSGQYLTTLNAANLSHGTVPIGRLGTNAPAANTFLRGDNTWAAPDSFPSGIIILSAGVPCPIGWTRVTIWDGLFPRFGATYGAGGGASTHQHGMGTMQIPAHGHTEGASGTHIHGVGMGGDFGSGINIGGEMNVDAGGSGVMARSTHTHTTHVSFNVNTDPNGDHTHVINNAAAIGVTGAMAAADHLPPFMTLWVCMKN